MAMAVEAVIFGSCFESSVDELLILIPDELWSGSDGLSTITVRVQGIVALAIGLQTLRISYWDTIARKEVDGTKYGQGVKDESEEDRMITEWWKMNCLAEGRGLGRLLVFEAVQLVEGEVGG